MGVKQVVWTIRTGLRGSFVFLKKLHPSRLPSVCLSTKYM